MDLLLAHGILPLCSLLLGIWPIGSVAMPRGISQRKKLAPLVMEMRETMTIREIASELNIPLSTVGEWCSDPDRAKRALRLRKYSGNCIECGKSTYGGYGPHRAPERCSQCAWNINVDTRRSASDYFRRDIEILWAEGKTIKEIAVELGWKPKSVGSYISRLRSEGYDLPYRRNITSEGLEKLRLNAKFLNKK